MSLNKSDPTSWPLDPVIDWLLEEGRFLTSFDALAGGLGGKLIEAGAPIARMRLSVRAHNGEVLKLIGDAVLAIFPVDRDDDAAACRAAIAAAKQALAPVETAPGLDFGFGIGLHLGDVVYGNVGSETRLDFTVMGRAVNFAARIEKLTRSLGVSIVCSAELAKASGEPLHDLGAHPVAGWDRPVRVFAPGPD